MRNMWLEAREKNKEEAPLYGRRLLVGHEDVDLDRALTRVPPYGIWLDYRPYIWDLFIAVLFYFFFSLFSSADEESHHHKCHGRFKYHVATVWSGRITNTSR